jgi:hypothetical protein
MNELDFSYGIQLRRQSSADKAICTASLERARNCTIGVKTLAPLYAKCYCKEAIATGMRHKYRSFNGQMWDQQVTWRRHAAARAC